MTGVTITRTELARTVDHTLLKPEATDATSRRYGCCARASRLGLSGTRTVLDGLT